MLQEWASYRGQVLMRTVYGIMYYEQAVRMQACLLGSAPTECRSSQYRRMMSRSQNKLSALPNLYIPVRDQWGLHLYGPALRANHVREICRHTLRRHLQRSCICAETQIGSTKVNWALLGAQRGRCGKKSSGSLPPTK